MTVGIDRYIAAEETWSVLYHVIPQAIYWIYLRITGQITAYDIGDATLYAHHVAAQISETALPVLLAHGDHSHPFTMLHFAEAMANHRVYSVYIPDSEPESGVSAMARAVDKVCSLAKKGQVLGIGHSKGGIYLVAQKCRQGDSRIMRVLTIGSRIRVDSSCDRNLVNFVGSLSAATESKQLVQGIPSRDWCASRASLLGRHNLDIDGSHLSSLFKRRVLEEAMRISVV